MPRPTADELRELARLVAQGDVSAFERIFRAFHAPLCELADAYVHSQDAAEEIVQDLFLAIWIDRARLLKTDSLSGYLFTATRNRAIRHLRHRYVVWRGAKRIAANAQVAIEPADDALVMRETNATVRRAIDSLPPRMRLAVVLQTYYEMANAEIATAMDISVKGVEKLLSTAKQKLRTSLGSTDSMEPRR